MRAPRPNPRALRAAERRIGVMRLEPATPEQEAAWVICAYANAGQCVCSRRTRGVATVCDGPGLKGAARAVPEIAKRGQGDKA